jgi:hypothetical protein
MEFKVSCQVKSSDKIDEQSIAGQLILAFTESICNLRTYLKLAQVDATSTSKPIERRMQVEDTELVINVRDNPFVESSITAIEQSDSIVSENIKLVQNSPKRNRMALKPIQPLFGAEIESVIESPEDHLERNVGKSVLSGLELVATHQESIEQEIVQNVYGLDDETFKQKLEIRRKAKGNGGRQRENLEICPVEMCKNAKG